MVDRALAVRAVISMAAGLFLTLTPAVCKAEQFVLFDETFTFTKEDADNATPSQSHYYVRGDALNPERPSDWTAPVDYRTGTVHIRAEVLDKPAGSMITQWVLCYIPVQGQGNGYGCTGTGTYTEEGLYERDVDMTSWWENEAIVWTQGIDEMHLVMKDEDDGGGFAHLRADFEKFFPTTMRITMIQVSAGSDYDPAGLPGAGGAAGGGGTGGTSGAGAGGVDSGAAGTSPSSGGARAGGNATTGGGGLAGGGASSSGAAGLSGSAAGGSASSVERRSDTGTASGCALVPSRSHSNLPSALVLGLVGLTAARRRCRSF